MVRIKRLVLRILRSKPVDSATSYNSCFRVSDQPSTKALIKLMEESGRIRIVTQTNDIIQFAMTNNEHQKEEGYLDIIAKNQGMNISRYSSSGTARMPKNISGIILSEK